MKKQSTDKVICLLMVNLITLLKSQEKISFALNNPLRCWIIELLKSHRALSSSELASLLHISLIRCYYHLDNLSDLVNQDKEKRYILSKRGIKAYELINRIQ